MSDRLSTKAQKLFARPKEGRNTEAVVQESRAHFHVLGKQIVIDVIHK